jgi:hypothetical protein
MYSVIPVNALKTFDFSSVVESRASVRYDVKREHVLVRYKNDVKHEYDLSYPIYNHTRVKRLLQSVEWRRV